MRKKENLVGRKFGNLTVIEEAPDYVSPLGKRMTQWKCKCDCGNEIVATSRNIKTLHTKSCGCLNHIQIHGMTNARIYKIWQDVKTRCYYPSHKSHKNYGGRGITMCDEWKDNAKAFIDWSFSHGYSDDLTLDRIDSDKGYSPNNCRWVTMKVQENNRRNNHKLEYNGETHTISEWANIYGVKHGLISQRLRLGWPIEKAITTPSLRSKNI